jgi:hypothetical protein
MGFFMTFIASIKKNVGWRFQELRDHIRKWWLTRQIPPVVQLFLRGGGFHLSELERLIADGADVNAQLEKDGRTALMFSAFMSSPGNPNRGRWLEVCRVLLEAGADPNTVFHGAHVSRNVELLNLLLKAGVEPCCSRCSVVVHDVRRVPAIFRLFFRNGGFQLKDLEQLIAEGADVNARLENDDSTALIYAAVQSTPTNPDRAHWLEVCRVLLEAGADPDAKAHCVSRSAFYVACMSGNVELFNLLLKTWIDPHWEVWLHDPWFKRQQPELWQRLRQWKAEQEAKRLDATLAGATEAVPNSRARL